MHDKHTVMFMRFLLGLICAIVAYSGLTALLSRLTKDSRPKPLEDNHTFLALLRLHEPPVVDVITLNTLAESPSYRMAFRFGDDAEDYSVTLYESSVPPPPEYDSDFRTLALLAERAVWVPFCDATCGYCGGCATSTQKRGEVRHPAALLR